MNWHKTEDGSLVNLDRADCVAYEGLGKYVVYFGDNKSCEISETDYENIKNILLNNGGK